MGYSTLYVQPLPHFKDANIATYIGREVCHIGIYVM